MKLRFALFGCLVAVLFSLSLSAQTDADAIAYLRQLADGTSLKARDVAELRVTDNYASPSGVTHVYVDQLHNGIPVLHRQAILHYRDGEVVAKTIDFTKDLGAFAGAKAPTIDAPQARRLAALSTGTWTQAAATAPAVLAYLPDEKTQKLRLVYQVALEPDNTPDRWLVYIDARTGEEISRENLTVYCDFPGHEKHAKHTSEEPAEPDASEEVLRDEGNDPAVLREVAKSGIKNQTPTYHVFPFGIESPLYGQRTFEVAPHDTVFSPFGWHDTNGQPGPEFTITRGNNVYAYLDTEDNDVPDSSDIVADGGDSLVFDFLYSEELGVDTIRRAALTQVFYLTNKVHDWTAAHGFDEAAGNFQDRNYSGRGAGRDAVNAEAQDGAGINNANFSTPPDGSAPTMQMFIWRNSDPTLLNIEAPADLAGPIATGGSEWAEIPDQPIRGELVIARDGTDQPTLVCEAVANTDEVEGKIVLIDRGDCFFDTKALNAQRAGALAVIVCNPENDLLTMASSSENFETKIPAVIIPENDCRPLKMRIAAGETVTVNLVNDAPPPVDGDFDNGIVAHEFGHGVSFRLIGGPQTSSCLGNVEQMGEGWSDFFTLASTPLNLGGEPDGRARRTIANFVQRSEAAGPGIRRRPYSTDRGLNDFTYNDIIISGTPHPLGEIWASTLWDLYWAFTDRDGFDDDLINGDGGNNTAVRLVIEGMKYTACRPGMLDGRDGILAADEIENDGANARLIWGVFAARGMGWSATQGSSNDQGDNREAFDLPPTLVPTLKVDKSTSTPLVEAGDEVLYRIEVRNDKAEAVTGVILADRIPSGMDLVTGSVRGTDDFSLDNDILTLRVDDIAPGESETVTYGVTTDPDRFTVTDYFDGAEQGDDLVEILAPEGDILWEVRDTVPYAGDRVFFVANDPSEQEQILQLADPVTVVGDRPVLRFFTRYETESGWDGGIVETSIDGGANWVQIPADSYLRGGYEGEIAQGAFGAEGLLAFWGDSEGYREQIADLGALAGQDVLVRWRFGSDEAASETGWWIDNIEFADLLAYDTEVTATTEEGDRATDRVDEAGIVVVGEILSSVAVDPVLGSTEVGVFPNPATTEFSVGVSAEQGGEARISLLSLNGRLLDRRALRLSPGNNVQRFATDRLAPGVYFVRVEGESELATLKLIVN